MEKYNHEKIESKWQAFWDKEKIWEAKENKTLKFYVLDMFPYPSAEGLHVGHPEGYTASDIVARYLRMKGFNVLHPMGWDAFGLPAENYAIKTGVHPKISTEKNIKNFKRQIKALGFSYDWSREINTTDPDYYQWTQWVFLQMFKKGLAYEATVPINWCPSCKTGLANEEVVGGACERCNSVVTKKNVRQWVLKITKYAERLLKGLESLDWPEPIKLLQRNWIGRSEGALVKFEIRNSKSETNPKFKIPQPKADPPWAENSKLEIEVFTTRPDTLFGATYMVLAPEHPLVARCLSLVANRQEVGAYVKKAKNKSDLERSELAKDKTGVELKGFKAINPVNGKEIPIWVADYVLISYGTGAIMAVPAHDERDWEFAKKYNLEIREVIKPFNKNYLVLHGSGSTSKSNWYPWLKGTLIERGLEVIAPDLPNSDNPSAKKWLPVLMKFKDKINKDSVIIGHSTGGVAALQLIQKLNKPIDKLILVAPVHAKMDWRLIYDTHTSEQAKYIEEFTKIDIDWQKIKSLTNQIIFYFSEDDPYINIGVVNLFKNDLGGEFNIYKDKKHFSKKNGGIVKFPEILASIFNVAYVGDGEVINSGEFNGLDSIAFKKKITKWLEKNKLGRKAVNYKQRDWVFSRQRYWGEPIPIIHCRKCGLEPVPEKDLPVKLPEVKNYKPTGTGESPLAHIKEWVNTKCPQCGGPAKRETNTMPQWAGSCWYYLRYLDPKNKKELVGKDKEKYWMAKKGVDLYVGGAEHAVLHLLYARFWHMFLYDIGVVSTPEPFHKLKNQGIVLGEDNQKMSKSKGNVINPDDVIKEYGADSMRLYEMFMGPFEAVKPWSMQGIRGVYRFLNKVWALQEKLQEVPVFDELKRLQHKLIKKVTEDIETFNFNTAVSSLMEAINTMAANSFVPKELFETFLILLSPFAPHFAEELWEKLGHKKSIALEKWPAYDPKMIKEAQVELVVQVNGKLRDRIKMSADISEQEAQDKALASAKVKKYVKAAPKKVIFVKNKLINFVV